MSVGGLLPQHIRDIIMSKDIEEMRTLMTRYEGALNSASADDAVDLFAPNGVIMAPHTQTGIGTEAIQGFFDRLFSVTRFEITFDIQEIVPTAPDWAFGRVMWEGRTDVRGRGRSRDANHELFIFQKTGGEWKIARYCFSSMTQPRI